MFTLRYEHEINSHFCYEQIKFLCEAEARNRRKTEEYYLHSRSSATNLPYCVSNPPDTPTPPPKHSPGTGTSTGTSTPVVYPLPSAPPPPTHGGTLPGLWCVAKPTVPDPIIREAMDYACGAGAECESILPGGSCYEPNTLLAHASFAFNSYWQRTKVAGGTCDFEGDCNTHHH